MTSPGFRRPIPATAGIPSLFELTGRVAPSEFSEDESRYHRKTCFSLHSQRVTDESHHSLLVNRNDHAWAAGLCVSGAPRASAATGVASKRPMPGRLQLCAIQKAPRAPFLLVVAVVSAIPFLCTNNVSAAEPKRVRTVHSFSGAAPPLTIHSFE
jgi:hypothetical protein